MPMPTETEVWLKIGDVADILCISRKSVYRLIDAGRLRAKNVSTSKRAAWRVHPVWLREFQECTVEGSHD